MVNAELEARRHLYVVRNVSFFYRTGFFLTQLKHNDHSNNSVSSPRLVTLPVSMIPYLADEESNIMIIRLYRVALLVKI